MSFYIDPRHILPGIDFKLLSLQDLMAGSYSAPTSVEAIFSIVSTITVRIACGARAHGK